MASVVVGLGASAALPRARLESAFGPHLDGLLTRVEAFEPAPTPSELPVRRGRVLVVTKCTRSSLGVEVGPPRLDDSMYGLADELRASTLEDTTTLILCDYAKSSAGHLNLGDGSGVPLHRWDVRIRAYDLARSEQIGDYTIEGEAPAAAVKGTLGADRVGERPDVVSFIQDQMIVE